MLAKLNTVADVIYCSFTWNNHFTILDKKGNETVYKMAINQKDYLSPNLI